MLRLCDSAAMQSRNFVWKHNATNEQWTVKCKSLVKKIMKQKLFLLSYASDFPGQYLGMAFLVNIETNVCRYCNII